MFEKIDGLAREDARLLIFLDQKIGDDELGNVLFALRFTLSLIADPLKLRREIDSSKNYERRIYNDFHLRRNSFGKTGPVTEEEVRWGDFIPEILNKDGQAFSEYLEEKYQSREKEANSDVLPKKAATDFKKVTDNLTDEEQVRLFKILGIASLSDEKIVFFDEFIDSPAAAEKHSEFIKKIGATLSESYKTGISHNPYLDPETHQAIKESGQYKSIDPEVMQIDFRAMPTDSLVQGLVAKGITTEMRQTILSEFLSRCEGELSSAEYKLFKHQISSLLTGKDWEGIVRLAHTHLQSKK
ncbi:MAG: hypothetical protein WAV73_02230 [Candidatus Moraniibacteriota bacterium]